MKVLGHEDRSPLLRAAHRVRPRCDPRLRDHRRGARLRPHHVRRPRVGHRARKSQPAVRRRRDLHRGERVPRAAHDVRVHGGGHVTDRILHERDRPAAETDRAGGEADGRARAAVEPPAPTRCGQRLELRRIRGARHELPHARPDAGGAGPAAATALEREDRRRRHRPAPDRSCRHQPAARSAGADLVRRVQRDPDGSLRPHR